MHKTPIQIRFNDIDIFGHVNNSVYNQYLDLGRMGYLNAALKESTNWKGQTLVLVHIENNYLMPTFLYDDIELYSSIYEIGNKSVKMLQKLVDKAGSVKMESRSVLSTFDAQTNASFILPQSWKDKIKAYESLINPAI